MSEGFKIDFDGANAYFGIWFDAKLRETTGGKRPRPKHDPLDLLKIKQKVKAARRAHTRGKALSPEEAEAIATGRATVARPLVTANDDEQDQDSLPPEWRDVAFDQRPRPPWEEEPEYPPDPLRGDE